MNTRVLLSDNVFNLFFMVHNRLRTVINDVTASIMLTDIINLFLRFHMLQL